MDIKQAVARLNSQLPLKSRQNQLGQELKLVHQSVLQSLVNNGRPPTLTELIYFLNKDEIEIGIQKLAYNDLVVLDAARKNIVGAYPLTIEQTPHQLTVNGQSIFAMCALDALSVAPMFNTAVQIETRCHVTQTAIIINMRDSEILDAQPSLDIRVGVRWQMPTLSLIHI